MTEAKLTWSTWQALLQAFAHSFTRRGFRRFAEWITAMALNVPGPTITQSVPAPEPPAAWKALENVAEYGGWPEGRVTSDPTRLVETAPGRTRHGDHVSAVDDTKVLPRLEITSVRVYTSGARCVSRDIRLGREIPT